MRNKISNSFLSFFLTASLLLPIGISFLHALENHEHQICNSKTEQHIHHDNKIDCSYFHYVTKHQTSRNTHNYSIIHPLLVFNPIRAIIQSFLNTYRSYINVRGPPN